MLPTACTLLSPALPLLAHLPLPLLPPSLRSWVEQTRQAVLGLPPLGPPLSVPRPKVKVGVLVWPPISVCKIATEHETILCKPQDLCMSQFQ